MKIPQVKQFATLAFGILVLLFVSSLRTPLAQTSQDREPTKQELERWLREAEAFETRQTEKLLGVAVQNFPAPQGLSGYDDLPRNAPALRFTATERPPTLPPPRLSFQTRSIVKAQAPDGSLYEGYSGRDEYELTADHGIVSTSENTRQMYGTHHGYGYNPQDVYIGKRVNGRIKPELFFRDVGSHDTAPFHFAFDSAGMVHLVVADVNNFQENRLDFYWVVGNPATGKWTKAWLIDRRGFTSSSHSWTAAWRDKVNALWHWCDESINKNAPGMGIFHLQWSPSGLGRKVRITEAVPIAWDAALDPRSGRILVAYSTKQGLFITSRLEGGSWSRPALLKSVNYSMAVSVASAADGSFIVNSGEENTREWVVRVSP